MTFIGGLDVELEAFFRTLSEQRVRRVRVGRVIWRRVMAYAFEVGLPVHNDSTLAFYGVEVCLRRRDLLHAHD